LIRPNYIAIVKKTFRYPNVFFYNRLYRNSLFRNFIMESGIKYEVGLKNPAARLVDELNSSC
jgi:hypothetical protein